MKRLIPLFFALFLFTLNARADDSVIIVLDASGSMWGKVDNKAKIDVARSAIKSLLKDWPAAREVGLVAYGHRSKGDCNDIETIIKPGPLDKDAISRAIDNITPKGMTPLSAAVKHAAEELKYTEKKATVILISDGVETCNMDPCVLGTELKKLGVDFTAHVIGFDVTKIEDQKGLKCLAENTGGKFFAASNTSELNKALETTVKAEAPVATAPAAPTPENTPEATATAKVTETPQPKGKIIAADTGTKGTKFEVKAEGAPGMNGFIGLFGKNKEKELAYASVSADDSGNYKSGFMQLPANTGDYTLRWTTEANQVIAERPLKIVDALVTIEAPKKITVGTEFPIKLSGPEGLEGYIYLYAPGKENYLNYTAIQANDAGPGYKDSKLRALATPGKFILKFQTNNEEVMATQEIEFVKADISIVGPDEAPLGTKVKFELKAPDGLQGYFYLYKAGKTAQITYASVTEKAIGGYEPVELVLPAATGDFEVKFVTDGEAVLASKAIKILMADISISAPPSAAANSDIEVKLTGPPGIQGAVNLYLKGKKDALAYSTLTEGATTDYNKIEIRMPEEPGDYDLKLENDAHDVLAVTTIQVTK
jgi:Ca-activated chloride channel family protein